MSVLLKVNYRAFGAETQVDTVTVDWCLVLSVQPRKCVTDCFHLHHLSDVSYWFATGLWVACIRCAVCRRSRLPVVSSGLHCMHSMVLLTRITADESSSFCDATANLMCSAAGCWFFCFPVNEFVVLLAWVVYLCLCTAIFSCG